MPDVTLYENANFEGRSKTVGEGSYRLFDLNDMNDTASSIKVPPGLAAYVYEHADNGGGYGISVDFLEDCADLSQFNFDKKISYITVFSTERPPSFIWIRGSLVNGEFVSGHWERKRAGGGPPMSPIAVVSPPIPPHDFTQPVLTGGGTLAVPDSKTVNNHVIGAFIPFNAQAKWEGAVNHQMGILGSDYRGFEEIGSAAFERASNNPVIPDFLNFWYPQKQPRDHRKVVYFKRTLSGTIVDSHISGIHGTYQDYDLNIDIEPAEGHTYLITDGHPREYTDIMSAQWNLSLHQSGQPNCDDSKSIAEFSFVEAELDTTPEAKQRLNDVFSNSVGRQLCVYGPWIYDKGHCCHSEIHPAEQIWWSDPTPQGRVYYCNVFCDSSERFWWRDQMDDGTKLKPWAAPPIRGTFAIAFEMKINTPAKQFEIVVQDSYNHVTVAGHFQRHHLTYQTNTLIAVVQDANRPVKVSFEDVGLVGTDIVRGFLVIEATVGTCTQTGHPTLPSNTDPNTVPQEIERSAFKKEAGHLMLTVSQGVYSATTINTLIDLNGRWASGGSLGPVISVVSTSLTIDMSAYHRPPAHGFITDASTITVTFADDAIYTGHLELPNILRWSNGSTWTKATTINTLIDLNGRWASGGSPGPVISVVSTSLTIDMSAYHRPPAHGSITDASTITVTFADDAIYTGHLELPNILRWSNGSTWTKV